MDILKLITQTTAAAFAAMYFAGWIYLYNYFNMFSIKLNELELTVQDYLVYSYYVFYYLLAAGANAIDGFARANAVTLGLPLLLLLSVVALEAALLIQTRDVSRIGASLGAVRWFRSKLLQNAVVVLLLALTLVVIAVVAKAAGVHQGLRMKTNQANDMRLDLELDKAGEIAASCTQYMALPEKEKRDFARSAENRWRLWCRLIAVDRAGDLQLLWVSKETIYAFAQHTMRVDGKTKPDGHTIVFRIPRKSVSVVEVARPPIPIEPSN